MPTQSLYNQTLILLQNRSNKLTLEKIAEDTGLKESWLSMFNQNRIPEPSVNKIQTLYEYLTKTILKV